MSYVPRRAKVVDVLAVRQVKQGTETTSTVVLVFEVSGLVSMIL